MQRTINVVLLVCVLCLTGVVVYQQLLGPGKRITSVNYKKVFEEFQLKKELEKKLENSRFQRQKIVDSLGLELNRVINEASMNRDVEMLKQVNSRKEVFASKREQYDQQNKSEAASYDKQIFTQMKQYAKDFAREHEYDWILSDDGEFGLVSSGSENDVTAELINYINNRYKGKHE